VKQPTSKVQALTDLAEALIALPIGQEISVSELEDRIAKLQTKARRALNMPWGNPNMAEAAEKGRAVRSAAADQKAADVQANIAALRSIGYDSYRQLADELNRLNVPSPTGGKWYSASVRKAELRKV
jgi:hypothetical protein